MDLCQYKDIFGEPETGLHSYRIGDIAVIDVVLTLILSGGISYIFGYSFLIVLIILLITGIILHRAFCVRTTIDKYLFPDKKIESKSV